MSTRRMMMASASHVKDGVIQDSWEEIAEACNKGLAEKYYSLGDVKEVETNLGTFHMELAGFHSVMQSYGNAAPTTWVSKECSKEWQTSESLGLRPQDKLNFPDELKNVMVQFDLYYWYTDSWFMQNSGIVNNPTRKMMEYNCQLYQIPENRIKTDMDGNPILYSFKASSNSKNTKEYASIDRNGNFVTTATSSSLSPFFFCL